MNETSKYKSGQEKIKKQLQTLVDKFKAEDGWSKSEEHIQTSFTIELLKILGWDSSGWTINTGQEVKTGKKPDIVLKSGNASLLVIESKDAKKKDMLDRSYANKSFTQQLFEYCRGEGLYWGVLTNFVEWRLYGVQHGRLYGETKYAFHDLLWPGADKKYYTDLLSEAGINFLFKLSKNELIKTNGIIDPDPIYYPEQLDIEQEKTKKQFFIKIKKWREQLRVHIDKNYPNFRIEKVDLMAQKIIDRMIFLDLCHDKKIISQDHLDSVLGSKQLKYTELKAKFRMMDEKFNTELFATNEVDEIKISDQIIEDILAELAEIDFTKLSVHVIGEVYENYLGELLRGRAKKEEVVKQKQKSKRKSQGIYYTPAYIVDYIVKNTLGELLKKAKTVQDIEKIRVLDPACGSGSFLIRAFDEFYNAYSRVAGEGGLLGFDIKKKILQNNIFGVDLDPKAVEIAKLNLMIKALEGATSQELKGKHLLPNLNLNIRCGNSLVGGEKLKQKQANMNLFDDHGREIEKLVKLKQDFHRAAGNEEKKKLLGEIKKFEALINDKLNKGLKQYFKSFDKVNPFNYSVAFCEIFKHGGFDAVIGNPPYVDVRKIDTETKKFLFDSYESAENRTNTFSIFIESGVNVLKKTGSLGFIIPNTILTHSSYRKLREIILAECRISSIYNLGSGIFKDAMVETIILILGKERDNDKNKIKACNYTGDFYEPECFMIKQSNLKEDLSKKFMLRNNKMIDDIIIKLKKNSMLLEEIFHGFNGINPGNIRSKVVVNKKIDDKYKRVIDGKNIKRYFITWGGEWILYDKKVLERARDEKIFLTTPKIMMQKIGTNLVASLDFDQLYALINTTILLKKKDVEGYDPKFIVALLNSRLLNFYYKEEFLGVQIKTEFLEQLPIKTLQMQQEKKIQKGIVKLVDEMLKLNKTPQSREKNKTKIQAIDYEIDQLVYKLYNLTDEEIKIIEEGE